MAVAAIRAGRAFVEIFAEDKKLIAGLRRAQARLRAFGASFKSAGLKMIAVSAAIRGAILATAFNFASIGDAIDKMAARTGIATEILSELGFVAEQSGADLETLEKGIRRMQAGIFDLGIGVKSGVDDVDDMGSALKDLGLGTSAAAQSFDAIGLSLKDLQGLDPGKQFELIADRIDKIEDPTTKAAVAMRIFGKSGAQLIPLFRGGSKSIRELRKEARSLGLSISKKEAKAAADFTDAWNRVTRSLKAVTFAIGSSIAPALTNLLEKLKAPIGKMIDFIKHNEAIIRILLLSPPAFLIAGAAFIAFGKVATLTATAVGLISTAITLVGGLLSLLLTPIGVVQLALTGLAAFFAVKFVASLSKANTVLGTLEEAFKSVKGTALLAFGGIKDALAAGDFGKAVEILMTALRLEFTKGMDKITRVWNIFLFILGETIGLRTARIAAGIANAFELPFTPGKLITQALVDQLDSMIEAADEAAIEMARIKFPDQPSVEVTALTEKLLNLRKETAKTKKEMERLREAEKAEKKPALITGRMTRLFEELRKEEAEGIERKKAGGITGAIRVMVEAEKRRRDAIFLEPERTVEFDISAALKAALEEAKKPTPLEILEKRRKALDFAGAQVSVAGTFSPFALRGLIGTKAADRTAKATEDTVKELKKVREKIERQKFG